MTTAGVMAAAAMAITAPAALGNGRRGGHELVVGQLSPLALRGLRRKPHPDGDGRVGHGRAGLLARVLLVAVGGGRQVVERRREARRTSSQVRSGRAGRGRGLAGYGSIARRRWSP